MTLDEFIVRLKVTMPAARRLMPDKRTAVMLGGFEFVEIHGFYQTELDQRVTEFGRLWLTRNGKLPCDPFVYALANPEAGKFRGYAAFHVAGMIAHVVIVSQAREWLKVENGVLHVGATPDGLGIAYPPILADEPHEGGERRQMWAQAHFAGLCGAVGGLMWPRRTEDAHRIPARVRPEFHEPDITGYDYRVIHVDHSVPTTARANLGGTHAQPRWHTRRAHSRRLPDGRVIPVKGCEVGDPERGVVVKDYVFDSMAVH